MRGRDIERLRYREIEREIVGKRQRKTEKETNTETERERERERERGEISAN